MNWSLYESRSNRFDNALAITCKVLHRTKQLQSVNPTETTGEKLIAFACTDALAHVRAVVEAILLGASTTGFG